MEPIKEDLEKVIDFCIEYNIPSIGSQINLYESLFDKLYDKYSNKHVARTEIWNTFEDMYSAYTKK